MHTKHHGGSRVFRNVKRENGDKGKKVKATNDFTSPAASMTPYLSRRNWKGKRPDPDGMTLRDVVPADFTR